MPIYAYRCAACGHIKDVLRKLSDPPLAECPACGEPRFEKQLTAAGFQLKGSGWYVTDFRNPQATPAATKSDAAKPETETSGADKADKAEKSADGAAAPAPAAVPAPATPSASAAAVPAASSSPASDAG